MLDVTWLCQQGLAGQADSVLSSLHPPSDLFSPVPQLGKEKCESEEVSEIPLLHTPSSAVSKSSFLVNNNHLSAKPTVEKGQT